VTGNYNSAAARGRCRCRRIWG